MVDTTVPAVAVNITSAIVGSVGVTIFGIQTGLDYPTIIAGFFGGALALSYRTPAKAWVRFIEVVSAAILAGYFSPVFAEPITHFLQKKDILPVKSGNHQGIQLCLAIAIAFLAHNLLLPESIGLAKEGIKKLKSRIKGGGSNAQ